MTEALTHVYIFPNHFVACFDSEGNQVAALQGRFEEIKAHLMPAIIYHRPQVEVIGPMRRAYDEAMKVAEETAKQWSR